MPFRRLDPFAVAASLLAWLMVGGYLAVLGDQGDRPATWVVVTLLVSGALAAYGAGRPRRFGSATLGLAAALLGLLGLASILSIGLPILVASALTLLAFVRSLSPGTGTPA